MKESTFKLLRSLFLVVTISSSTTCFALTSAVIGGALPIPILPADNPWNTNISTWPVDPNSATFLSPGSNIPLHADAGGNAPTVAEPNNIYGLPYIVVSGVSTSDLVTVNFTHPEISDGVDHTANVSYPYYPIPIQAQTQVHWVENGAPGNMDMRTTHDRHMIIIDKDNHYLYELYNVYYDPTLKQWNAYSGASWNLNQNEIRPDMWMSADASGLAILPGLLRYDEVYNGTVPINHALRFTLNTTGSYVFPATHWGNMNASALPMGSRIRLKSSVNIANRISDPYMQKIFKAIQQYGLILSDIGSNFYVTGTYDTRWDTSVLENAFASFTGADFELVQLGYPQGPIASLASIALSQGTVTRGGTVSLKVNLSNPAPVGGAVVRLSATNSAYIFYGQSSLTIPAGQTSATATFTLSSNVASKVTLNITASYKLLSLSTVLTVTP